MKKLIFFLLLFSLSFKVNAYYCDYEYYNGLQKKALNVNIMTDYEIIDDKAFFTITIYNMKEDQYIINTKNNARYNYNSTGLVEIQVNQPGIYSFEVYSNDNYCNKNYLNKLVAEIPTYNKYYKDKLCTGIESFKYCQRWFSTPITYEEFKKGIIEYKNRFEEEIIVEEEYKSIGDYILEFYLKYWYILLPSIIVVCLLGIYLKLKQENKFKL